MLKSRTLRILLSLHAGGLLAILAFIPLNNALNYLLVKGRVTGIARVCGFRHSLGGSLIRDGVAECDERGHLLIATRRAHGLQLQG